MKLRYLTGLMLLVVMGQLGCASEPYSPPEAPDQTGELTLVWRDEFNGDSLDTDKWTAEVGDGCPNLCGWGSGELEYYRSENATVADGMLAITAKEESYGSRSYTSARIKTQGKFTQEYGNLLTFILQILQCGSYVFFSRTSMQPIYDDVKQSWETLIDLAQ